MNCDNKSPYFNENCFDINWDKIYVSPLKKEVFQKNIYTTQGFLRDHTIMDTYTKQFSSQMKCDDVIKYAPFDNPCFHNRCSNILHNDFIMNKITKGDEKYFY